MSDYERGATLYRRSVDGRLRFWFMERDGARYRSGYGFEGSEPTFTGWTTAQGKNAGRSNATDPEQQAAMECQYEYSKKRDRGFSDNPDKAGAVSYVKPMLAKTFDRKRVEGQPWIAIQPKLDGIRCIVTAAGAFTRNGKPIVSIPHIMKALASLFVEDPDLVLDGELYNHALRDDFNRITSLVRKQKPTSYDLFEVEHSIRYHIYDIPSASGDYVERHAAIRELVNHRLESPGAVYIQRVGATFVGLPSVEETGEPASDYYARMIDAEHERPAHGPPAPVNTGRCRGVRRRHFHPRSFPVNRQQPHSDFWTGQSPTPEMPEPARWYALVNTARPGSRALRTPELNLVAHSLILLGRR